MINGRRRPDSANIRDAMMSLLRPLQIKLGDSSTDAVGRVLSDCRLQAGRSSDYVPA